MPLEIPGYRVTETLFNNEHTAVHRAIRISDQKAVILKQLVASYPEAGQLSKFSFGYEVLSKFSHPNIVKPIAWLGAYGGSQDAPVPTMVLEDRQGIDLFHYLQSFSTGHLPIEIFLDIAIQLSEALSVIHYHQVIHKDLHPGNIIINPKTGLAQITDFGLASLLSREQPALEIPEKLEGVLAYISPEQTGRMNRALDYRTDFYTLGITFYEMLAGHPPFSADDALGMVHAHIAKKQLPLTSIRSDIPSILAEIIDKLLNKTAEDRYQSALGLKKDLEKVRNALARNKPVPDFPLGMEDISDRFQVPQKLYGRSKEVELLLQRFLSAAGGKPQTLAIAGYSGIGKSALVHEVHKPIAAYGGIFCTGKFDQFQRNVPYSALQIALKGWLMHTLSLPEAELAAKKNQLLETLGSNARVLIDFMPVFESVLGYLPEVTKLGADETQNRFHLVFQKFIQTISWERPLVLFIDDLQWADRGTLNLLPQLMAVEECRLLVIVAYRDNEVDAYHPTMQTLAMIEKNQGSGDLNHITLAPLAETQVVELLQDALHRPKLEVEPLASLVHTKTAGNPFFIGEFLKTLYTEKLLDFNLRLQRWEWNLLDIQEKDITDNVVELMLEKMAQLPDEAQSLIQLAACVGSRFDLDLLARVAERPTIQVTRALWPALRDGLLIQDGGDWRLGIVQQDDKHVPIRSQADHLLSQSSPLSPQCRFLHDRMLQAAYESMSETLRQNTHLRVGRLLLKHCNDVFSEEDCFAIVEQLSQARTLISDPDEKKILVKLNLQAAHQAWKASVWEAAVRYSTIGIDYLPEDCWQSTYEVTVQLYHLKAETEYLCGRPEASDILYQALFSNVKDSIFKANICVNRLVQSLGRGEWAKGIDYGVSALTYLDLNLPEQHNLQAEIENEKSFLLENSNQGLIEIDKLPEMTKEKMLIAMKVYPNLSVSGLLVGKRLLSDYCALKGSSLLLTSGVSDLAAIQLTCYAIYLHHIGEPDLAFRQGVQAKKLLEKFEPCREIANCYNMLGSSVWYLKAPYDEAMELNRKGTEYGMENGEIARAVICQCTALGSESSKGEPLEKLLEKTKNTLEQVKRKTIFFPWTNILYIYTKALISGAEYQTHALDLNVFDNETLAKTKGTSHYFLYTHYRSLLAFWFGDEEGSLDFALQAQSMSEFMTMHSYSKDHLVLLGLLLLRNRREDGSSNALYEDIESQLSKLAATCPENFSHKYHLLMAEKYRYCNANPLETVSFYQRTIKSANENGFIQYAGLACELFAEYWLDQDSEYLAEPLIQKALTLYRIWGCTARINYLLNRYGALIQSIEIFFNKKSYQANTPSSKSTQSLDMASVMKSAQAISKELNLQQLSTKVLEVIMECAGASSAALIMNLDDTFRVRASAVENKSIQVHKNPESLETTSIVPISLIRYVLQSRESINIGDTSSEHSFANDDYMLKHRPSSILAIPVSYRDKLIGALYLENRINKNAFTPDRLDIIKLLLAQVAISFENAQLFDQVKQLNENLELKVEKRTKDLNKAIYDLEQANIELNAFSYSVSHDLRAPLRHMRGFSQMIIEDHSHELTSDTQQLLKRIVKSSNKMNDLIDGLLMLARIHRKEAHLQIIDLSSMIQAIFSEMKERFPNQDVELSLVEDCRVFADERILYSAMENLVNNAWKYSSKKELSKIEFGILKSESPIPSGVGDSPINIPESHSVFYIKDNGDGFDINQAQNLFGSFQRLHTEKQFEGTGIGLATVKRAINKLGGKIWAVAAKGQGATFYFTLKTEFSDNHEQTS